MNNAERTYAMNRLTALYNEKERTLSRECSIPAVELKGKDLLAALRKGTLKVRGGHTGNGRYGSPITEDTYLGDVFDFSPHNKDAAMKPDYETRITKLKAEYSTITDQLMLGDSAEALALIQEFAKFTA